MNRERERDKTPRDTVEELARLFAEHPAWRRAAQHIDPNATSDVYFSSHPGRAWHLERRDGTTRLCEGRSASPDLVFRFTPQAVLRLAAVRDGIGNFARTLFLLMLDPDPEVAIRFRIVAPFPRLLRRGYLRLLLAGGPALIAFGAEHGVRGLGDVRSMVRRLRSREPEPWESAE
jgi:hypothetical protein